MSQINFKQVGDTDYSLHKVQQNIDEIVANINNLPFLNGVTLEEVTIGTSNTDIAHKLGRKPVGWLILRKRSNATVWDNQNTVSAPATFLRLVASAQVSVDLYVF